MYEIDRRSVVLFSLFGWISTLEGCGGAGRDAPESAVAAAPSSAPSPGPPAVPVPAPAAGPPPAAAAWYVGAISFTAGSGATKDLAATLPNGVARGGTFGVSGS